MKKAASSSIVKSAVSTIVLDAAVPVLKSQLTQRFEKRNESEDSTNIDGLGNWDEPTTLGIQDERYTRYLRSQLLLLSEYEHHLESFGRDEFEGYVDRFYQSRADLNVQENANEFVIESLESYINHLEHYAVRNEGFREYVEEGSLDIRSRDSLSSSASDRVAMIVQADEYITACEQHIEYLLAYAEEDPEYETHANSFDKLFVGSVADMENAVLAAIQYLDYLNQFTTQDPQYRQHKDAFTPTGDAYYSLVAAENELIKNVSS